MRVRRDTAARAAALALLALAACGDRVETRVLHRSGCEVCHRPLDSDGVPAGIEDAHPWAELSCTDCHGGNAYVCDGTLVQTGAEPRCDGTWVYDQDRAHPDPGDSPEYLRDLHAGQLDDVDEDWLRFVNPGDMRVLPETCGRCHTAEAAAIRRSAHAHAAGELAVARFRAGKQSAPTPVFGAVSVFDANADRGGACAVVSVNPFDPLVIDPNSDRAIDGPTVANAQEHLLAKQCIGCHIQDFGRNDAPGTFRSSGCTACHIAYAEDGVSRSLDPWIDKQSPPHPIAHRLEAAAPSSTCTACHHDGARIGLSFRGIRDPAGPDWPPTAPVATLDRPLYGHPAGHYVTDEDTGNAFDETPPDVHFEAGMDCVDCHTRFDLHGDGHLYGDAACVVRTTCEDCHGTVREAATTSARRDNVFRGDDGGLWLRTKRGGVELRIPQVIDAITPGDPHYSPIAAQAKGVDADGWSHSDDLACVTCHAGWMPNCYGCHVEVDLTESAADLLSGDLEPGTPRGRPMGVATQDLVLLWNQHGKLAPSMPAERMFYTLVEDAPGGAAPRFADAPRAFGQRAIDPHTTRRRSAFMACDRCHTAGELDDPDNAALLDLTHGFGTPRYDVTACDPEQGDGACAPGAEQRVYRLDAVIDSDGTPLVEVGHPFPELSRPLTLEEIDRMRAVTVPADAPWSTPAPASPDDRSWPPAMDLD